MREPTPATCAGSLFLFQSGGGMAGGSATIQVLDRRLAAVERRQVTHDKKLDDLIQAVGMIAERLNGNGQTPAHKEEDSDRLRRERQLLIGGVILALAGIALKAFAPTFGDWPTVALVLAGGALIPGNRIVELVRAGRRSGNGNGGTP